MWGLLKFNCPFPLSIAWLTEMIESLPEFAALARCLGLGSCKLLVTPLTSLLWSNRRSLLFGERLKSFSRGLQNGKGRVAFLSSKYFDPRLTSFELRRLGLNFQVFKHRPPVY